jgi:hypothetical protein
MVFELVRGYFQLASGLGELTRARATELAQGLLSLPAVATGGQVAVQAGALAEELLAAAAINRQNLRTLVHGEVDAAVTRLGLVPAEKLEESQAETARLRAELGKLRSASPAKKAAARTRVPRTAAAAKTTTARTGAAKSTSATRAAAKPRAARSAAAKPTAPAKPAKAAAKTAKKTAKTTAKATTTGPPAVTTGAAPRQTAGT